MLLILKQPDFGMTLVWIPVILAMLFVSGLPKRYMIALLVLGLRRLPCRWSCIFGLKPYQRDAHRLLHRSQPRSAGSGWAINQSLIAIGSGGFKGKGFKATGTQVEQGFIPGTTVHTDYINTAIGEQWGFVGETVLISTFAVLLLGCLFTAHQAADEFGLIIVTGFTTQIFFHVYQNIGMTIALMPITGIPLPLISYGGTFLVMLMFALGLVNSVWVHRKQLPG